MNILFVCEIDWLRKVVLDIHTLAEALSLLGHRVYALDYESMWERDSSIVSHTTEIDGVSRALAGSSVCLIRPAFLKIPILSRVSASVSHYRIIRDTIKDKSIDVIILYSVPTNGLQTLYWARELGIPVVFRSIDILNQLVKNPVLRAITKSLERRVYSRVDKILTLTPGLSGYVVGLGADHDMIKLLPMPLDISMFYPMETTGISAKKVVLFMGTLFDFSGLDTFIPRFKHIIDQVPDARLLVVGGGPQQPKLERIITECGLQDRIVITGFLSYQHMPHFINSADVCINTFITTGATRDIFPGKTVQFLACGKPLVATALPGMKAMIAGEEQGIVYVDSVNEMVDEVVSLLKDTERRHRIGQNGLEYVRRVHDCRKVAGQLEEILERMVA